MRKSQPLKCYTKLDSRDWNHSFIDCVEYVVHKNLTCLQRNTFGGGVYSCISFFPSSHIKTRFYFIFFKQRGLGNSNLSPSPRCPIEVSWQHGDNYTLVLNVDGSVITNPGRTSYGCLVRNSDDNFLFRFYGSVGL